uniref:Cytochrome b6-f complex subunit 6 n=1 Tax=Acrosorium ciliolatum TaxID=1550622 RepID=A0A1Z1M1M2_9FLOR|nr:cytochrome b6-f complex subunit 6 [Acrosorium ciliolatum]ARW59977.1 cytochrome b6-f complex subunit 6 [Acrosorium ciliolatum]
MSILLSYILFVGIFFGLTLSLYFGLQAIKII